VIAIALRALHSTVLYIKSDGLGFVSALYVDGRRSWRRRIVAALRGCLPPLLRKIAQLAASYSIVPIDGRSYRRSWSATPRIHWCQSTIVRQMCVAEV